MKVPQLPSVTIAIPTFNRADRFLAQALQSAVSQSYKNLEIIVADNCSTDNTETLVKSFQDHRILYVKHEKNIGAENNFSFCVNQAKGMFFHLLHDDDLIDNDFISSCIVSLKGKYDTGVVFTGNRVIDENSTVLNETHNRCNGLSAEDFLINWFEGKVGLYLCSSLYNTEKLRAIGGFTKTDLLQDAVADILLAWHHGRSDVFDIKASFRRHTDNRGGNPDTLEGWCDDCLYVYELLCGLPTKNKKIFCEKALKYFAKKNYKLAETFNSLPKRIIAYSMINRKYKYQYTPWRYFYEKSAKPVASKWKNKLKQNLKI